MNVQELREFGKRADNGGTDRQAKAKAAPAKSKRLKDYAFKATIGLLCFMTIGFLGQIMKGLEGTPDGATESTVSVTAPLEPVFDGGLLKEPTKIDRSSEPQATYTVQKVTYEGKGIVNVLHSRYSDASGMWFTHAKYDCNKGALFTLAGGEDAKSMSTQGKDYKWSLLVDGSSATQVARLACAKADLKLYVSG